MHFSSKLLRLVQKVFRHLETCLGVTHRCDG